MFFATFFVFLITLSLPANAQNEPKRVFYKGEGHRIVAPLPAETGKQWTYETDNGTISKGKTATTFIVYPARVGKCRIWAKAGEKQVWATEFEVLSVPAVSAFLASETGKEVSVKNPLPMSKPYQMKLSIDSTYLQNMEGVVNFLFTGTVGLYRGGQCIKLTPIRGNELMDFKAMGARAGDAVLITSMELIKICSTSTERYRFTNPYIAFFLK